MKGVTKEVVVISVRMKAGEKEYTDAQFKKALARMPNVKEKLELLELFLKALKLD